MKSLKPNDFKRSDYITNRRFVLTNTSSLLSVNEVEEQSGHFYLESAPTSSGGFYKGPFFSSVKQFFYNTEYKTETNQIIHNKANVLQVDPRVFDEKIKEGSVRITDSTSSAIFVDDSQGNLFVTSSEIQVGNVFYEFGTIVITDTGSYANSLLGNFELDFRVQHTNTELSFQATVQPNEFRFSNNPSSIINGKTEFIRTSYSYSLSDFSELYGETITSQSIIPEFFGLDPSGSEETALTPHVTTIGFYNDSHELLAVGKLSSPTPLPKDFPITFRMRIDI